MVAFSTLATKALLTLLPLLSLALAAPAPPTEFGEKWVSRAHDDANLTALSPAQSDDGISLSLVAFLINSGSQPRVASLNQSGHVPVVLQSHPGKSNLYFSRYVLVSPLSGQTLYSLPTKRAHMDALLRAAMDTAKVENSSTTSFSVTAAGLTLTMQTSPSAALSWADFGAMCAIMHSRTGTSREWFDFAHTLVGVVTDPLSVPLAEFVITPAFAVVRPSNGTLASAGNSSEADPSSMPSATLDQENPFPSLSVTPIVEEPTTTLMPIADVAKVTPMAKHRFALRSPPPPVAVSLASVSVNGSSYRVTFSKSVALIEPRSMWSLAQYGADMLAVQALDGPSVVSVVAGDRIRRKHGNTEGVFRFASLPDANISTEDMQKIMMQLVNTIYTYSQVTQRGISKRRTIEGLHGEILNDQGLPAATWSAGVGLLDQACLGVLATDPGRKVDFGCVLIN